MSIKKKLKKAKARQRFVRLKRYINSDEYFINRGYILSAKAQVTVMWQTENFHLLGKVVLSTSHIESIRYNSHDRYYDFIVESEEQKDQLDTNKNYCFKTWMGVFQFMKNEDKYVIIELERKLSNSFIIGPVISVNKKSVKVLGFNASGEWDKKPSKVKYKDVTQVTFDDPYITIFRRHTKSNA